VPGPRLRIPFAITLVNAWLSELYSRITDRPVLVTVNGVRSLQNRRITSSAKAQRELGARFRPLEETLGDEVTWFRAHEGAKLQSVLATSNGTRVV
jgi:dihydroflavonol-4-reductase